MQIKWKFNYYKNSLLSGIKVMFCVATCCPHSSYTFPKYVFRNAKSNKSNSCSCCGRGQSLVGWGAVMLFMHVLAVGRNDESTGVNFKLGGETNPRTGSWSVPVPNCIMWASYKSPLLPP